jgi:hypothetical protein
MARRVPSRAPPKQTGSRIAVTPVQRSGPEEGRAEGNAESKPRLGRERKVDERCCREHNELLH